MAWGYIPAPGASPAIIGAYTTYADLPDAASNVNRFALVQTSTGIWPINLKQKGLYVSNGTTWFQAPDMLPYFKDTDFTVYHGNDESAKVQFDCSLIATGTVIKLTVPNHDITLGEGGGGGTTGSSYFPGGW